MLPRSGVSSLDIDVERNPGARPPFQSAMRIPTPQFSRPGTSDSSRAVSPLRGPTAVRKRSGTVQTGNTELLDEDEQKWMRTMSSMPPNGESEQIPLSNIAKPMEDRPRQVRSLSFAGASTPNRRNARSMDVMEAVRQNGISQRTYHSAVSLASVYSEKTQSRRSNFASRVFEAGKPDLLYDLTEKQRLPWNFNDQKHGVLDLTTLQRMNQHVLQQKLVEQVKVMGEKEAWMEIGVRQTLHDYCEAVRDMEFMEQCASRGTRNDPFLITTAKGLESVLLEDAGLVRGLLGHHTLPSHSAINQRLPYMKREVPTKRKLRGLFMALAGGLALIVPFLIMILVSGQLARIIALVAFVVAFAFAMSVGSELTPDRLAMVTAAYAAALVVFVGTNPPTYGT